MDNETKISRKSLVSLEVLILAIGMIVTITTTSMLQSQNIKANSNDIAELKRSFKEMHSTLDAIDEKLDALMWANEMSNKINTIKSSDRWSASAMIEHDNHWLRVLQKYHPEITHDQIPDVRGIQADSGYGNIK